MAHEVSGRPRSRFRARTGALIGGTRRVALGQHVLTALPVGGLLVAAWQTRWMSDDGFIHVRVVRQVLAGNGPVFNAGERVETSTSALWVALLTVVHVVTRLPLAEEAVRLGILLSAAGLVAAQRAGVCFARARARARVGSGEPEAAAGRLVLPVGALVVAALPPFWEFASSGLETGLAFAWIGGCCWWCAYRASAVGSRPAGRWAPIVAVALVGLGPLIRPDLAVFSVAFGAVLVVAADSAGARLAHVAALVAAPAAYQVFRMGYYAQLVPNPALAKSAARAQWSQGWIYLQDFVGTYRLIVPLGLLAAIVVWQAVDDVRGGGRGRLRAAARLAPVGAALVHAGYIVGIGGDFMHARMFLPAAFAIVAPVGVPLRGSVLARTTGGRFRFDLPRLDVRRVGLAVALPVLAVWVVVCALTFRPHLSSEEARPYPISEDGIADERAFFQQVWEMQHPVSEADYPFSLDVPTAGHADLDLDGDGWPDSSVELTRDSTLRTASAAASIGAISAVWGTNVYVIDAVGLAHPIGSRIPPVPGSRIGHEKPLPVAWQIAGLPVTLPSETLTTGRDVLVTGADLEAARAAVECGQLGRYLHDVRAPLTPARFLGNIVDSFANTLLRVPEDPVEAAEQLCDR